MGNRSDSKTSARSIQFPRDTPASERIRRFRERSGMTQSSLASSVGVSAQTVKNWESGRSRPYGPDVLQSLFLSLGLTCVERVALRTRINEERIPGFTDLES